MSDPVEYLKDKFNDKVKNDERARTELEGITRIILIEFPQESYTLRLDENGLEELEGEHDIDITITTTPEVLADILEGKLEPMKAYSEGLVKVDASLMDMLKARHVLG